MTRVAINGLGRIGRAAFKQIIEDGALELAAVNDLVPAEELAYLLKHDSVYGRSVTSARRAAASSLTANPASNEKPWTSCPGATWPSTLSWSARACSRTKRTSSVTPRPVPSSSSSPRRSREVTTFRPSSTASTPPTAARASSRAPARTGGGHQPGPSEYGAAKATIKALPEYDGKFDDVAIRAPVPVGSIADIVCLVGRRTSTDEVNSIFREEAGSARYRDIVGVSDCTLTQVVDGDLVKVMSWYDNEWGYAAQLTREAKAVARHGLR